MPVTVSKEIVGSILATLPPVKASEFRAGLVANGIETADAWEFADNEAWLRCIDAFYPHGRPPGPVMTTAMPQMDFGPAMEQAKVRSAICKTCGRYGGDAGMLSVHCRCKGRSNCSNVLAYSAQCPEGKW